MPDQTTHLGIPYPLPGDAVVDYPGVGRDLAETLEALILAAAKPPSMQAIAVAGAGQFTVPDGAVALFVEAWGGGGGGAGTPATASGQGTGAGGGGGGAYSCFLFAVTPGAIYNYAVGAGGAGGVGAAAGGGGGQTIFGTNPSANGGGGGAVGTVSSGVGPGAAGGAGGNPQAGTHGVAGDDGDMIFYTGSGGFQPARGGKSPNGGGSGRPTANHYGDGAGGHVPGGGGNGAFSLVSAGAGPAHNGGAGAIGRILVTVYYGEAGATLETLEAPEPIGLPLDELELLCAPQPPDEPPPGSGELVE